MAAREVTVQFEVPEVYRLVLQTGKDGVISEARVEGEFISRQIGALIKARYTDPHKAIYVVERLCGACSHAHTLAFASSVEKALGIGVPSRAAGMRVLGAELERIQSHAYSLSEIAAAAGSHDVERSLWGIWQAVTAILAELSGSRVHYGLNVIGGVTRDVSPGVLGTSKTKLAALRASVDGVRGEFSRVLGERLAGLGVWAAKGEGLPGTGPNQRASGSCRDIRKEPPYALYGELAFGVPGREEGDCFARASVRLEEIVESCRLAEGLLSGLPGGEIRAREIDVAPDAPLTSAVSVEAPRGEDRHEVALTPTGEIRTLTIRVPTEDSLVGVAAALVGVREPDARIVVASFDLCMSCFGGT